MGGLLERSFDVTVFHRGSHEVPELSAVRHIHADPHFFETIDEALTGQEFDLVVATYGRIRHVAQVLSGRAGQFIAVSGASRYSAYVSPDGRIPTGLPAPVPEDDPLVGSPAAYETREVEFARKIVATERAVHEFHPTATILVYPLVYGPRNMIPWEWSVIRRVRDGRTRILLPDDGLTISRRGAARNVAKFALLAVDRPTAAAGQVFNCADARQFTLRQWVELVVDAMGSKIQIVGVPGAIAPIFRQIYLPRGSNLHSMFDITRAQQILGYTDAIDPKDALLESVEWYLRNPISDTAVSPAYYDTFDYVLEDALIDGWGNTVKVYHRDHPQSAARDTVHPLAHPREPGLTSDHHGR